jgi:hypothetical protein
MSFLETMLGYIRGRRVDPTLDESARKRAVEDAWGLDEADRTPMPVESGAYDWTQWRKKLQRILDGLPATEPEWEPMMAEARSLGFGDSTVSAAQIEEFTLLIRRAVADCVLTPEEHRKLEIAQRLLGLSADDAEQITREVIREAETFFGGEVREV